MRIRQLAALTAAGLAAVTAVTVLSGQAVAAPSHGETLQLTGSAAVFGFATTQAGMSALMLIVPFSSYLLCGRLVAQHFGTLRVAQYIREELSDHVPGGLRWEAWLQSRPSKPHLLGSLLPLLLTFVGAGALALAWTSRLVFARQGLAMVPYAGLTVLWVLGLVATVLSTVLVLQMANRLPVRSWDQTGLS